MRSNKGHDRLKAGQHKGQKKGEMSKLYYHAANLAGQARGANALRARVARL